MTLVAHVYVLSIYVYIGFDESLFDIKMCLDWYQGKMFKKCVSYAGQKNKKNTNGFFKINELKQKHAKKCN